MAYHQAMAYRANRNRRIKRRGGMNNQPILLAALNGNRMAKA